LLANAVLTVALVTSERGVSVSGVPNLGGEMGGTAATAWAGGATGAIVYYEHLRSRGFTVDETKPLVLGYLEAQLLSGAESTLPERYWESDATPKRLAAELALLDKRGTVRDELVEVYGTTVERDALLARAFRPLDSLYGFLDSAEQIALQRHQLQRQLEQATANASARVQSLQGSARAPSARSAPIVEQPTMTELGEFLDASSLDEFLYRYSPLAEQLRAARLQLDESEFRQAFQLLQQLDREGANPSSYLNVRAGLRRLLGGDRVTRLWAARDPLYTALVEAAPHDGLTEQTTLATYQILNDSQERLMQAAALRSTDPVRSREEIQQVMKEQHASLLGLLGENGTKRVLAVQSELGQRLSGGVGSPRSALPIAGRAGPPPSFGRNAPRPPR
jgi:hypothetical protein